MLLIILLSAKLPPTNSTLHSSAALPVFTIYFTDFIRGNDSATLMLWCCVQPAEGVSSSLEPGVDVEPGCVCSLLSDCWRWSRVMQEGTAALVYLSKHQQRLRQSVVKCLAFWVWLFMKNQDLEATSADFVRTGDSDMMAHALNLYVWRSYEP